MREGGVRSVEARDFVHVALKRGTWDGGTAQPFGKGSMGPNRPLSTPGDGPGVLRLAPVNASPSGCGTSRLCLALVTPMRMEQAHARPKLRPV